MMFEACPRCGGENTITTSDVTAELEYGIDPNVMVVKAILPVHFCKLCKFSFLDDDGSMKEHEAICRAMGILTPLEVSVRRKSLGFSQQEFASIVGLSLKRVEMIESARVFQTKAEDLLLRTA